MCFVALNVLLAAHWNKYYQGLSKKVDWPTEMVLVGEYGGR